MRRSAGPSLTRAERSSLARRERARAHLARVRSRGGPLARVPRPRALLALAALTTGALTAALALRLAADLGELEAIHVRGAGRLSGNSVAAATGVAPGAAMGAIDAAEVARTLATDPRIREARARRLPLGHLLVSVVEREPLAVVEAGVPPQPYAVDATGTPFAPAEAADVASLPRLVPAAAATPGQADVALAGAAQLAQRAARFGLAPPREVHVAADGDPEGYALRIAGLPARVVLGRDELDARLSELARLLAAEDAFVARATSIDLRFAGQAVLRTEPPS